MAATRPVVMSQPMSNTLCLPQFSAPAASPIPAPLHAPAASPVPFPLQAPAPPAAQSTSSVIPEQLMHKNRLQEYAQRSAIPLPIYQTVNEGSQHAPQFRSTVLVDGASYTSPNTFSHRKAAEQDVAKIALANILQKIKEEGCPLILQDTVFCKSILNEFAVKMNLEMPTYSTIQPEGLLPTFISSLVFSGESYTGEAGRNKKEAEQLAARAVILSLLGKSGSGTILSEIIKSKVRLYAALHKVKDPCSVRDNAVLQGVSIGQMSVAPQGVSIGQMSVVSQRVSMGQHSVHNDVELAVAASSASKVANPGSSSGMPPLHHEFKPPKSEPCSQVINIKPESEAINLPIAFVPPAIPQPLGIGPSTGKRRWKNKKKANKKRRPDTQQVLPIATSLPLNQAPPCSVAQ